MNKRLLLFLPLLGLWPACARAQIGPGNGTATPPAVSASSAPAVNASTAPAAAQTFGVPLDPKHGPWVLGDVKYVGNVLTSQFELESRVRARKGILYTPEDVDADVSALMGLGQFAQVTANVYAIPGESVPPGFASIAASTNTVRLVFALTEKGAAPLHVAGSTTTVVSPSTATAAIVREPPPAAVSGVVLTPTAYRGLGHFNRPGLGLDFNGVYYIGRLYGKNSLPNTLGSTNYLDRIGQWLLSADGKMQLQSEGTVRPAVATGGQVYLTFRDSPQPATNAPTVTATVSPKTTQILTDAYFVISKNLAGVRTSAGFMEGNAGNIVANLSEFLTPNSLFYNSNNPPCVPNSGANCGPSKVAESHSVLFASMVMYPKPAYPLGVELFKPNGMARNPILLNFKLGYFLHLNFDLAYLKFQGGYDLLGDFQFRFNYFPSR